jgi:hypothetical protein
MVGYLIAKIDVYWVINQQTFKKNVAIYRTLPLDAGKTYGMAKRWRTVREILP